MLLAVVCVILVLGTAPSTATISALEREDPVVLTTAGPIFGFRSQFDTFSFRGVPFAAPPLGDLRFAPPVPPVPWTEPRNATVFGPGCYSKCRGKLASLMCAATVSEDCLYLNVYTPTLDENASLPVIFFIHGGMYSWGSGGIPLYDGSRWAKDQNVVLVTINYRLNIFGGLFTGTLKGNFQTLDQRQALQWVSDNIARFGGDPTRVLLSGESAGATSVGVHLVSPKSWPLFQRAAVISNPYGLIPPSAKMAAELGAVVLLKLGCPSGGAAELACLRNKTTKEIFAVADTDFLPTPNEVLALFMQWSPVVDGDVLPMQPIAAMQQQKFNKVPLYIGTVANETIPFIFGINSPVPEWIMDLALDYVFNVSEAATIRALYGPIPESRKGDARPYFSRVFTDFSFYCPSHFVAKQASRGNGNRTYVYLFDEHPSWRLWYANNNTDAPCYKWICHAFDLPSIFNTVYVLPPTAPRPTAAEEKMAVFVQTAWAQFAARGEITEFGWPRYSATSPVLYNISVPIPTAPVVDYRGQFCAYFEKVGWNRW